VQIPGHAIEGNGDIQIGRAWQVRSHLAVQSAVASQGARDLADPIRPEVEADAGILVTDSGYGFAAIVHANKRLR